MAKFERAPLPEELKHDPNRRVPGPAACAYLGISGNTLRKLVKQGVLAPVSRGANSKHFLLGDLVRVSRGEAA